MNFVDIFIEYVGYTFIFHQHIDLLDLNIMKFFGILSYCPFSRYQETIISTFDQWADCGFFFSSISNFSKEEMALDTASNKELNM